MNKKTQTEKKLKLKKEKVSYLLAKADLNRAVGGIRTIGSCSAGGGPVSDPACGCVAEN